MTTRTWPHDQRRVFRQTMSLMKMKLMKRHERTCGECEFVYMVGDTSFRCSRKKEVQWDLIRLQKINLISRIYHYFGKRIRQRTRQRYADTVGCRGWVGPPDPNSLDQILGLYDN